VCCAPDYLSSLIKRPDLLGNIFYFYNPNVFPQEEYERRLESFEKACKKSGAAFILATYDPTEFNPGLHCLGEEEGGARCSYCIELRLKKTAELCLEVGADSFTSTLLASPRKSLSIIDRAGKMVEDATGVVYEGGNLRCDRSSLSPFLNGIYVQDYCGCKSSLEGVRLHRVEREKRDLERFRRDYGSLIALWQYRGRAIRREQIPIVEEERLKDFLSLLKPSAILVSEQSFFDGKSWLKTGSYNCRILREYYCDEDDSKES
jgi:hypothetical protein